MAWKWFGSQANHNAITAIVALAALLFARNINIKIDSIEQSIKNLYQHYALETFCPKDIKNYLKTQNGQYLIELSLKNKPVSNSVNVWEGTFNISPNYFDIKGNTINLESNFDPKTVDQGCNHDSFQYIVTYVKDS
jgi:hypothetical protein